jgi:ferredoxin-NADP reductase
MTTKFKSKVIENKSIAEDVKNLVITTPKDFNFIPGQYISLIFDKDGKRLRRPYSIASPSNNGKVELCIKIISEGLVTPTINEFQKDKELEILGPLGDFIIEDKTKDLILISTGTGIGPYRSIIPNLLENNFKNKITLIAGYRKNKLYDEEFQDLSNKYNNFEYKTAISSNGNRVQDIIPINKQADYYLCGLKEMINSVRNQLVKQGIEMKNIIAEKYD